MKRFKEEFILSTGKVFRANRAIIGLGQLYGQWELCEGYDGVYYDEFTEAEIKEIAEYMISLWKKFKAESGGN